MQQPGHKRSLRPPFCLLNLHPTYFTLSFFKVKKMIFLARTLVLPARTLSARTLVFPALHPLRPWLRWLPKLILYFIYLMSWLLSLNTITILYSCYYTHDIYYIIYISINPNNNFILCNKLGTPGVDTKITILVLKVLRTMITCMGGFPTPAGCPTNLIQFWPYLPGESIRSHRLGIQSHNTVPPPHFRCQLQVQIVLCTSDWPPINQRFPQPPPRVWLICWNGSQNSEKHFTY